MIFFFDVRIDGVYIQFGQPAFIIKHYIASRVFGVIVAEFYTTI